MRGGIRIKTIYKEDAFQIFDDYKKRYSNNFDSSELIQLDYVRHYCKKFNVSFTLKNKRILGSFYKEWNELRGIV